MLSRMFDHPHMLLFQKEAEIPPYAAVGLLETLYRHWAYYHAPRGDIGQFTDKAIAVAVEWEDAAERLIEALIASHWVARSDDQAIRLGLLHLDDMSDQAWRQKVIHSHGGFWWDGSPVKLFTRASEKKIKISAKDD